MLRCMSFTALHMCIYTGGTMAEIPHESVLPNVKEEDIEVAQFEDLTDPAHMVRWLEFVETNPLLARVLLKRAQEMMPLAESNAQRIKIAIDLATYAVRNIEIALERETSDDAGDDEGRQP